MLSKTFVLKASLVLAIFMGLSLVAVAIEPPRIPKNSSTGAYEIYTLAQLNELSDYVANAYGLASASPAWSSSGKTFILMNDISGFSNPIGTASRPFLGTFDGNDKKITLSISSDTSGNFGVFGYARNATIKNLTSAGEISYSNANGTSYIAGIVGYSSNTSITNCYNYTTISVNSISNTSYVGGISAYSTMKTITNCDNLADISVSSTNSSNIGGIVGRVSNTSIEYCSNAGTITSTGTYVGGIVGYGNRGISNCVNMGTIKGAEEVGGIGGGFSGNGLNNCANAGWISGNNAIGGIIGKFYGVVGHIQNCLNTGVVQGTTNVYALIGFRNGSSQTVSNCFYDKQMAPYNAIQGIANPSTVYSLSTNELTQPIIKDALGDAWIIYPDNSFIGGMMPSDQVYSYPTLKGVGCPIIAAMPARLANNTCWNNVSSSISLDCGYYYNHQFMGFMEWPPSNLPFGSLPQLYWQSNTLHVQPGKAASMYGHYFTHAGNPNGYNSLSELTVSMGEYKKTIPIIPTSTFKIPINDYEMYGFEASEVSPNIVTSNAVMDVSSAVEGYLNVAIFDMSGAKVMEVVDKSVTAQSQTQVELNGLNNLTAGSYIVAVSVGNNVVFRRFVKQ